MRRALALGIPSNVFFLGLVSFLTDVSSDMLFTLLPLYLANVLVTGTVIIGLIEGIAESTATLTRIGSGYLSDLMGKRKPLALLGYGLSSIAKPFLYFASNWGIVLGVRFADRLGKGIRTAPRDALVADSTPEETRGRGFGFHRALDTYGAVVGLLIASGIVYLSQRGQIFLTAGTFRRVVIASIIPAFLAVLILLAKVKEPLIKRSEEGMRLQLRGFDLRFKLFLMVVSVFTLAKFGDAFFVLRAQDLGLSPFFILLLFVLFNLVYASFSLPAGIASDRGGRRRVIVFGWLIYGIMLLGFGFASETWHIVPLFILYGLYYGSADGVLRAFVADLVPQEKRGTAYGLYHGAVGVFALPASIIAGVLWEAISPQTPFFLSCGLTLISCFLFLLLIGE